MNSLRYTTTLITLFMIILAGCQQSTPEEPVATASEVSEIADPQTGARLAVEVSQTEIDLTEVLLVNIQTTWDPGVTVELIDPNWSEVGWNHTEPITSEIIFDGSVFTQSHQLQLSAFLDGQYIIPSIGIRSESESTGRRITRLQEIPITVTSVLDPEDEGTLDASVGLLQPKVTVERSVNTWILALGGFGVLLIAVAVFVHKKLHSDAVLQTSDPQATLSRIAKTASSSDEVLCELHRALLDLRFNSHELDRLTSSVETTRYSKSQADPQWVRSTAQQALKLCGGSE